MYFFSQLRHGEEIIVHLVFGWVLPIDFHGAKFSE